MENFGKFRVKFEKKLHIFVSCTKSKLDYGKEPSQFINFDLVESKPVFYTKKKKHVYIFLYVYMKCMQCGMQNLTSSRGEKFRYRNTIPSGGADADSNV